MPFPCLTRAVCGNVSDGRCCSVKPWYLLQSEKAGGARWAGGGCVLCVQGTADVSNEAEMLKPLSCLRWGAKPPVLGF